MQSRVMPLFCIVAIAAGCASEQSAQPVAAGAVIEPQSQVTAVPQQSQAVAESQPQAIAESQPQVIAEQQPPPYVPQVNTFSTARPVAQVTHAIYKQVLLDGDMPQWVVVEDIRRSRTNDGYERIQVLVKNKTQVPIRTKFRFDWQDANGVVVVDPDHDAWEKETLLPGDNGTFTSIAPRKDCADFRLRMAVVQ